MATDLELLAAWRNGDRNAGNELFAQHGPALVRFFRNKVDEDVDDLVQRTFLASIESRDRVRDGTSFRAYLLRIARNEVYDYYVARQRGFARVRPAVSSVIDLGASPSFVAATHERDRALLAALRRLPLDLQTALELYYWEDLTTAEMADILDVPQGTVKTRLMRARDKLREIMQCEPPHGSLA